MVASRCCHLSIVDSHPPLHYVLVVIWKINLFLIVSAVAQLSETPGFRVLSEISFLLPQQIISGIGGIPARNLAIFEATSAESLSILASSLKLLRELQHLPPIAF
ncbi:hypothetical protein PIB30_068654 [Stylosanthes scabra]|uniref:Uncharacterized protein n=1 Tax=Stylosanthes scabra TaxID=79078 RepID=A0ABU6YQM8_9FABA|nr:hypothetical protein [Stylosanthes scabra]